jgi:hypothetical protein
VVVRATCVTAYVVAVADEDTVALESGIVRWLMRLMQGCVPYVTCHCRSKS